MPSCENDFSERLEIRRATDARQEDAVLPESFRRPEPERDGSVPRLAEPRPKVRKAEPGQLVLSAQRHVRRDESALCRIRDAPYRLDVGPDGRRHEEGELGADRHVGGARVVRDERANGPRYFGVAGGGSAFQMFAWIRQLPFTCFQTLMYLPRSVTPAP